MTKYTYQSLTPTRRAVRDYYHGEPMDAERTEIILMLVLEHGPPRAMLEGWSEVKRRLAANWAIREHLIAGDNRVLRLPKPPFLKNYT